MNKIDKIYLLNLEKRKDRLNHFIEECKRERVDINKLQIFKGLDAENYNLKDSEIKLFSKNMDINTYTGKACACNQLGHYYIFMDMIKNNYDMCLIFQDDARFKKDFIKDLEITIKNVPEDAEIVWIGLHKVAVLSLFEDFPIDENYEAYYIKSKIKENDHVSIYKDDVNPASLAYILTKKGAINYIQYINKTKFNYVTDENFNKYLIDNNKMYGSSKILVTGNSKFKSDIFKYDNNALEREMLELLNL
jgi:GR25 family glycosyltransferase involved in LPS biosynthesis